MAYGTRRGSTTQQDFLQSATPIPISSTPTTPSTFSSSSISKPRRLSTTSTAARRRLSSGSASAMRPSPGIMLSHSVPVKSRLVLDSPTTALEFDDEDDGEVKGAELLKKKEKGQLYECEKCSKVYRHSTCLVKHRWEHTAHWKEASKLLLSKHQQVQLLEAAAILKAASSGSSLPDEKSYWPAAVSPPSSGLLGSQSLNINVLSSPRLYASQSLHSTSLSEEPEPDGSSPGFNDDEELDEDEEDEESESVSTGDDMLVEGMFDMDIDEQMTSSAEEGELVERSRSVGTDSGYGSLGKGPVLGFFEGGRNSKIV